jgi:hypothetical protein
MDTLQNWDMTISYQNSMDTRVPNYTNFHMRVFLKTNESPFNFPKYFICEYNTTPVFE